MCFCPQGASSTERKEWWVDEVMQIKCYVDSNLGTKKTFKNTTEFEKGLDDWVGF